LIQEDKTVWYFSLTATLQKKIPVCMAT